MPLLQVITASTREGRKGAAVAEWFVAQARAHGGFDVEPVDLRTIGLPLFDEPEHPSKRNYQHAHTREWSVVVERADAFVFVTPEYDNVPPAALTNALHYLVHEWKYKPAGFVSYGGVSAGLRSVQQTKLLLVALKMMPVPEAVNIPFFSKHLDAESGRFVPPEVQEKAGKAMLDELLRWTEAMRTLRAPR